MRTIEQMKANAQNQLDGMTCNREHLAKDVLALAGAVQRYQAYVSEQNAKLAAVGQPTRHEDAWDEFMRKARGGL